MEQQLQEAYIAMVAANLNRLKAIARSYSDRENREDLLQEMLYQLWRGFASFEGKSQLDTWVYRVALNTAITDVRRRDVRPQLVTGNEVQWDEPHHSGEFQDSLDILQRFLSSLDKIDRAIMLMYLDDISHKDISRITGQSVNVIGVRISRMKQRFKQRYVDD